MKHNFTLLNAFTRNHFNGAQIAVFSQADNLKPPQMLQLAQELNSTATVFISNSCIDSCDAKLEIYNPQGKCDFAGHAVVAACFNLSDSGRFQNSEARIELNGQILSIIHSHKNKKVQISIPLNPVYDEYVPSQQELAQIIGLDETLLGYNNNKPMITGCPEPCLMIPIKNNEALRLAQFNINKWQLSFVASLAKNILLFTGDHPYDRVSFTARLLGKNITLSEDPPIGSVAPAFGLYLAYGLNDYHRSCSIQRGDETSRISIIEVNVDKIGSQVVALQLGGHAIKMAEGYFDIPDAD